MLQTERPFILPRGFIDQDGTLHRDGVMRLATAADEILPLRDPRVRGNEAYLVIILLSRVITHLGSVSLITPNTIEGLFASDLSYLQALYNELNKFDGEGESAVCPHCEQRFTLETTSLGESAATPSMP